MNEVDHILERYNYQLIVARTLGMQKRPHKILSGARVAEIAHNQAKHAIKTLMLDVVKQVEIENGLNGEPISYANIYEKIEGL